MRARPWWAWPEASRGAAALGRGFALSMAAGLGRWGWGGRATWVPQFSQLLLAPSSPPQGSWAIVQCGSFFLSVCPESAPLCGGAAARLLKCAIRGGGRETRRRGGRPGQRPRATAPTPGWEGPGRHALRDTCWLSLQGTGVRARTAERIGRDGPQAAWPKGCGELE